MSVRAPWWWAILHGKPVENRDWYTRKRGRVWLHASKWWNQSEVENDLEDVEYMAEEDGIVFPPSQLGSMKALGGHLVGTVEIVDCVTDHPSAFFQGKFGFVLRNPIALEEAIPFKGALGFFDVPEHLPIGSKTVA